MTTKWSKNHACGEGEPADRDRRKPPREERRAGDDSRRSQGPGAPKSGLGQHRPARRGLRPGPRLGRQGEREAPRTPQGNRAAAPAASALPPSRRQCPRAGGWAWRAEVPARSWLGEPETEGPSGPPDVEPALGTGRPAGLAQRSRVSLSRTLACLAGLHVASLCWRNSPSGRVLSVRMPHSTCLGLICIINTLLPLEEKL